MSRLSICTVFVLTSACYVNQAANDHSQRSVSTTEDFDGIEVSIPAGNIDIRAGAPTTADLRLSYSSDEPQVIWTVEGGVATLEVECKSAWSLCGADLDLVVPAHVHLDLDLGAGNIHIDGLQGNVNVETGAGDLNLSHLSGDVQTSTGAGDMEGERLTGANLRFETGVGNVNVVAGDDTQSIRAASGAGDIDIEVASGEHQVHSSTGLGDVDTSGITISNGASRSIHVETGVGDVTIAGR